MDITSVETATDIHMHDCVKCGTSYSVYLLFAKSNHTCTYAIMCMYV